MKAAEAKAIPARIESLLDGLYRTADPIVSGQADELVSTMLSLYGAGLERVVELLDAEHVRALADDELVANLLLLHGLHPDDVDTRVQRALDGVRPYLGSHAGGIEYLGVDPDGVAHLRLEGSCDHCPSSSMTVQTTVERAVLDAAPEVERVEVENMVVESTGPRDLPLLQIQPRPPQRPAAGQTRLPDVHWESVDLDTSPGVRALRVGDVHTVLIGIDDTPYVYLDRCGHCAGQLS